MFASLLEDRSSQPKLSKDLAKYSLAVTAMFGVGKSDPGLEPDRYERVLSDLVGILALVSKDLRFVIFIDDVTSLDKDSLRFLEQVCLRAADITSSIIIASNLASPLHQQIQKAMSFLSEDELRIIELGPLTSITARKLASLLNCTDVDRAVLDSGGNPLFLETNSRASNSKGSGMAHPIDVYLLPIMRGLDRRGTRILRFLSVFFGGHVNIELLKQTNGSALKDFDAEISRLTRLGLLRIVNGMVGFRNDRIRQVVRSRLPTHMRREFHEAAYRHLQTSSADNWSLGTHANSAHIPELAIDHFRLAGIDYYAIRDFANAYKAFAAARRMSRKMNRSVPIGDGLKQALSCMRIGKRGEAKKILSGLATAAESSADIPQLSEIYRALANHTLANSPKERMRLLGLALNCAPVNSRQRLFLYIQLAQVTFQSGQLEEAFAILNDVETKAIELGAPDLPAVVSGNLFVVYLMLNAGPSQSSSWHLAWGIATDHCGPFVWYSD